MALMKIPTNVGSGGGGADISGLSMLKKINISNRTFQATLPSSALFAVACPIDLNDGTLNTLLEVGLFKVIERGKTETFTDGYSVTCTVALSADGLTVDATRTSTSGYFSLLIFG